MQDTIVQEKTLQEENQRLREKLQEAEALIDAIRNGKIDALVVSGPGKESIYTLETADRTYRILIETMDEGAAVFSAEGTILYCNRRLAEMLGCPIHRMIGTSIDSLFPAQNRRKFYNVQQRAFSEQDARAELLMNTAQGRIPTLVSLRRLSMDALETICMVVTDLTELKKTEATLKSYSQRLSRQNKELKRRADQLARLSAALTMAEHRERKRISQILHDSLQQMLASAKLEVGCLAEKIEDGLQKKAAEKIEGVLADSIKLSRSLSMDLSPPVLHESGLEEGLKWLVRSMAEKYDFNVGLYVEAAAELSETSKVLVYQAVRELLFNSKKHAEVQQAKVILQEDEENRLRIEVSDSGVGFESERLAADQDQPSGFGLFSIRERIGQIGGRFHFESAPGKGSRFTLVIPKSSRPVVKPPAEPDEINHALPRVSPKGKIRVLIVDDHTLFRQGIANIFSREPDIELVGQATDGREAIELARHHKPDVILMDISMPGINGIEATAAIHQEIPHIRIIGLSMYEDQDRALSMFQAGAVNYKNKTCPASELLDAVRVIDQ